MRAISAAPLLAEATLVLAPGAAAFALAATGAGPVDGAYRGVLAALVVVAAVGALSTAPLGRVLLRLVLGAAVLAGLVVLGGRPGPGAAFFLALALGVAAQGLAAAGRAVGASCVGAAAVALGVVVLGMTGLHWADAAAARVPASRRHALRQAVLDADPALAAAYGVLGHDRMRDEEVYFGVPLASGLVRAPRAADVAAVWLVAGAGLALTAALAAGARGKRGAAALDGALAGREGGREPPERSAAPRAQYSVQKTSWTKIQRRIRALRPEAEDPGRGG